MQDFMPIIPLQVEESSYNRSEVCFPGSLKWSNDGYTAIFGSGRVRREVSFSCEICFRRSSLPKFNVVREFLHSLGNVVGVVVPRILDDG